MFDQHLQFCYWTPLFSYDPLLQSPSSPSVGGGSLVLPLTASVHLSDRTDGEPRLEPGRHPGGGHAPLVQQVHARVSVGPHHAVRAEGHPGPEGHERERQQLRGAGLLHLRHGRGALTHTHTAFQNKGSELHPKYTERAAGLCAGLNGPEPVQKHFQTM